MSGEIEKTVQHGVSASRWLLAPMYLGLALMLIVLLIQFVRDFVRSLPELFQTEALEAIPAVLSLAVVLLAAHALLLIIQTGYQLFAPGLNPETEPQDRAGRLDFTGLRNRLLGAAIALALVMVIRDLVSLGADGAGQGLQDIWPLAVLLGLLLAAALVLAVADWFTALAAGK